jgi:hypothetical protein
MAPSSNPSVDLGDSWLDLLSGPMTAAVDGTRYEIALVAAAV